MNPVIIGNATLYLGDCLDILPGLPKVDAVITDPPYGKVRGDFDHVWTNRPAMLPDVDKWLDAIMPKLKYNATLWWFAWPSLAGRIEARIAERLNPLAHIVWQKPAPTSQKCRKEILRAPIAMTERLLMAEHYGADNAALGESGYQAQCDDLRGFVFEPLRAYLAGERDRAGLTTRRVAEAYQKKSGSRTVTGMAGHWFERVQWTLPTAENYQWLRELFNANGGDYLSREYDELRREYDELRREYDELRREYDELRRYFNCERNDQFSDIWQFPPCLDSQGNDHPTRKPVPLIRHIVKLSVRPGAVALDPFMGSGTTGVACMQMGRQFIGIEKEPRYFDIACKRIERAQKQPDMFIESKPAPRVEQASLFAAA